MAEAATRDIQVTRIYAEIDKAFREGFTTVSLQGSSRSSKTYNAAIWLVLLLMNRPRLLLSVVRATLPALKGSVYRDFREILVKVGVWDWKPGAANKSELTFTFPNGSMIEFFSTDDEQKLRGRKRDVLFVNEANELPYIAWQQLKMRTTRFSILDYNPSFSDEHWICAVNQDPRTYHFVSTYKDNPFLEQTVIDEIESLRDKNRSLWQIYGLGIQAQVEGLVFKSFGIVDGIPAAARRRWIGVDFGFTNDPTAIVLVATDGRMLYVDEICYRTEMLTSDIVRVLKDAPRLKVISESTDPRLVQEIYRAGIDIHPVRKFPGSVMAGIAKMQEYGIALTRRSANAIREFKNYTYRQDKEGKWLNEPIDMWNHAIDSVRYVTIMELLGGERKPIDRERLSNLVY